MRLVRMIANLGYGSRREVAMMFREGRVTDADGEVLYADDKREHAEIRLDGEPLDPPQGLCLVLNKPAGVTCSTRDTGRLVHELLPERFALRNPKLSTVGRLDRETTGLLLLTDDGALLHRIISPRSRIAKVYEAELAEDLRGDEVGTFASGNLMLESEQTPLLPAELEALAPRKARLTLHEGRYHQARRMFAAVGNHVLHLHRVAIGGLTLDGLEEGAWRTLDPGGIQRVFAAETEQE
ncbi:pseudouridine synthase [Dokdonella sp.]|uniref:pseudouridine synthase n=1 Tax=Dokdonella sp. TaxID=2291710 RepID=UPI00352731B8